MSLKTFTFEGGSDGVGITTSDTGSGDQLSEVVPGSGGTITYSTTTPMHGALGGELTQATAATSCYLSMDDTGATDFSVRFYLRLTGLPDATVQFPVGLRSSGNSHILRLQLRSTGLMEIVGASTLDTSSVALTTGVWYRISFYGTGLNGSSGSATYKLYTGDSATPDDTLTVSSFTTAADATRVRFGKGSSATLATWRIDDIATNLGSATEIGIPSLLWEITDSIGVTDPGIETSILIEGTDSLGLTDDLTFTLPETVPIPEGTAATYQVLVDWAGDGSFGGVGDDVTARTLGSRHAVSIQGGRNSPSRAVDDCSAGEAQFVLQNSSRDYSPENGSSPLAGLLGPGREVAVRATFGTSVYNLFRGNLDDYTVRPSLGDRSVELTCLDGLGRLAQVTISTPLYRGVSTGQAIGYVLDVAGWPAGLRDLDAGHTAIAWWWEEGTTALDALRRLVRAEGPPALIAVDGTGQLVFRDRTHRYLRDRSRYAQAVLAGGGDEPQALDSGFTYDAGWRALANRVEITSQVRACTGLPEQIWSSDTQFTLADGETVQIVASSSDPFLAAITPTDPTDFTLSSGGGVVATLSRTSGAAVTISVTATSGAATVASMALRASPVRVATTIQTVVEDTASVDTYGPRSYTREVPWVNANDAAAIANIITTYYADRLPMITFKVSGNTARLAEQLERALSDQVTVSEDQSGVNGSFFIERIAHEIAAGPAHVTTFTAEQAPAQITNPFRFDVEGAGFNQGLLAKSATVVTPLFVFDTDGQGFNDGLFAS